MMETVNGNILKKVQNCQIDILKQIDIICRKYELEYFGVGGTVLGAVRHQGFIPWDDDMDIGMPRKDYEKFLEIAIKELPEGYHVQNYHTEPKTPFYFTKIRKDATFFGEYYLKDCDIHQGIFVDVFPFDNVPSQKMIQNIHYGISRVLYQIFLCKSLKTVYSSNLEQKSNIKSDIRKIIHYMLFWIPKSWIFHALDYVVRYFNRWETDEISHIVRRYLRVFFKDLYPIKYLKFNDIKVPVPNNCDAYLKGQYGDYMKLPPKEKRHGHLPYKVQFDIKGEH